MLILTSLTEASTVGMYAVALTCASASGGLTQALNQVSYSRLAVVSKGSIPQALASRSVYGALMSMVSGGLIVGAVALVGERLFGPGFELLLPTTAILVLVQLLNDQWQLRVYFHSANEAANSLALSSGAALVALGLTVAALELSGIMSGIAMAWAVLGFAGIRLVALYCIERTGMKPHAASKATTRSASE